MKKNAIHTKYWLLLFVGSMLFFIYRASSQQLSDTTASPAKRLDHTFFVELLGNGVIGTLNYDLLINRSISFRIGLFPYTALGFFSMPLTISPLIRLSENGSHFVELGGGLTVICGGAHSGGCGSLGTLIAGYRYQPVGGGFFFKLAWTPIFIDDPYVTFGKNWAGLGFGFSL